MKKRTVINISIVMLLIQVSCRTPTDLVMFRDLQNNENLYDVPAGAPEYIIKPYDNLYVNILTLDPEMNNLFNPTSSGGIGSGTQQMYGDRASQYINGYMVSEAGDIKIPIIGQINVAGLNLSEAQELINQRALEYLKEPNVKIKVLNFKINVLGEVNNPGIFYNYEGSISILDAISMANGITDYANVKDVVVIRHHEDITETFNLDFSEKEVYASEAFYLQPNDVVYIKPNRFKGRQENRTVYSLMLSTISTIMVATSIILNNTK